ncbi:hypothetical protein GCM10010404_92000 [Nonomuraea africana]
MLRRTLGDHARQHGSLVDAGRLRFDFSHFSAVDPVQLHAIEAIVNDHLMDDPEVRIWQASRADSEAAGATALFGEKYGEQVRIVDIGDFSRELCGGTHVGHGSNAGPIRVLGESSIGSNLRRIEALTGHDVLRHYDNERRLLEEVSELLGTRPADAPEALRKRLSHLVTAQQELDRLRAHKLREHAQRLLTLACPSGRGHIITKHVTGISPAELRQLALEVIDQTSTDPTIVILGLEHDGKAMLVAAITPSLTTDGIQAAQIITRAAKAVGGGGGGTGAVASAGGRHPQALGQALQLAAEDASNALGSK